MDVANLGISFPGSQMPDSDVQHGDTLHSRSVLGVQQPPKVCLARAFPSRADGTVKENLTPAVCSLLCKAAGQALGCAGSQVDLSRSKAPILVWGLEAE